MIADPIETMPRDRLEDLQSRLLRRTCSHAWRNSPFYRRLWSGCRGGRWHYAFPGLPFISKEDLVENSPFGLCAVPRSKLIRMSMTSGTSGRPAINFLSRDDLRDFLRSSVRKLAMRGVRRGDVVQLTISYNLSPTGIAVHLAAEEMGCLAISSGPGNTKRQLWLMEQLGTTVLYASPDYHLRIAEVGEGMGIDFSRLDLRIAISSMGRMDDGLRKEIEERLCARVRNSYGLSEVGGVAAECDATDGLHSWQDEMLLEVIDPATGEAVADGERGELVVTTLKRRAMPLIRYRTGDMVKIHSRDPCDCGRTHLRLSGEIRRRDDSVKIKGVLVNPGAIEGLLGHHRALSGRFLIQLAKDADPRLLCELSPSHASLPASGISDMGASLAREVRELTGLRFDIAIMGPDELPVEQQGKRVQVIA